MLRGVNRLRVPAGASEAIDRPYWSIEAAARYCVSLRCIGCAALLRNGRVDTLELLGITSGPAAPERREDA